MPFTLTLTRSGLEKFTAAQLGGDIDLTVTEVGLTDAAFVVAPTLEAVPDEHRRVATISGDAVGDNIVHLIVRDDSPADYSVRGFGFYLADGTLFAVYGQAGRIVQKSALTSLHFALDIAFPAGDAAAVTFGDTNFLDPPATTERRGVIEIATGAEATAGIDQLRAIVPATLKLVLDAFRAILNADIAALQAMIAAISGRTITGTGLATGGGPIGANPVIMVSRATSAEVAAGTRDDVAVTPLGLASLPKLLEETGYQINTDGSIRQWGKYRAATTSETTASVTFPIAFPNAVFPPSLTGYIAGPSVLKDLWPQQSGEATLTGFVVQFQRAPAGDPGIDGFNWECWGR